MGISIFHAVGDLQAPMKAHFSVLAQRRQLLPSCGSKVGYLKTLIEDFRILQRFSSPVFCILLSPGSSLKRPRLPVMILHFQLLSQ